MKKITATTHFTTGAIEEIVMQDDKSNFRWTRKYFGLPSGLNFLSEKKEEGNRIILTYEYFDGLVLTVQREFSDFEIKERYTLSNPTEKKVDVRGDCLICFTFADDSDIAEVALKRRAYTRIFSSGNCFAVYNSKFSGEEDGVGVVLTNGVLGSVKKTKLGKRAVSVYEVGFACKSLEPSEEYSFEWVIFAYENVSEFLSTVLKYQPFPLFSSFPILRGEEVDLNVDGKLFLDGLEEEKRKIIIDSPMLLKIEREDEKYFEFNLVPKTEEDYARQLFVKSFHQKEKELECIWEANKNPERAKELLLKYFKRKHKRFFDFGLPLETIQNDGELKKMFLEKAEYALSKEKGYYYPYQTIAKLDFLKKAYVINPDHRYLEKIDELTPLANAIFRLWID